MSLMRSRTWSASMRRILELDLELVKHELPLRAANFQVHQSLVLACRSRKPDEGRRGHCSHLHFHCSTHGLRCRIFCAMMVLSLSSPTCPRLVRHPRPRARGGSVICWPRLATRKELCAREVLPAQAQGATKGEVLCAAAHVYRC